MAGAQDLSWETPLHLRGLCVHLGKQHEQWCVYTQCPSPSFTLTALATFGKHSEAFCFTIFWERAHEPGESTLMPY